jgi:hypothetical protein
MPGKQLHVNLRQYDWWTVQELASALEISEDEARKRLEELLALEVVCGDEYSGFRFNETYRQMKVTVVKQSGIVALLDWFERWQWNRLMRKDQKVRTKQAARYQERLRNSPSFFAGRFSGRY